MPVARAVRCLLLRPVMLVLALAQLLVVIAPSFDRADDRDTRIHLETEGTRLHYVHDDTACPVCQTQHLIGRVVPAAPVLVVALLEATVSQVSFDVSASARHHHPASPRSPPVARVS